jgi:nucleoside triphosphate pyrophosphatase
VHTGVAVCRPDGTLVTEVVTTSVTFAELSDEVIAWYVATGEPTDKAGAYGLQGIGGALVERIDGSVSNVLGLPLTTVRRLLAPVG